MWKKAYYSLLIFCLIIAEHSMIFYNAKFSSCCKKFADFLSSCWLLLYFKSKIFLISQQNRCQNKYTIGPFCTSETWVIRMEFLVLVIGKNIMLQVTSLKNLEYSLLQCWYGIFRMHMANVGVNRDHLLLPLKNGYSCLAPENTNILTAMSKRRYYS